MNTASNILLFQREIFKNHVGITDRMKAYNTNSFLEIPSKEKMYIYR
jgi:hypothetical protein